MIGRRELFVCEFKSFILNFSLIQLVLSFIYELLNR